MTNGLNTIGGTTDTVVIDFKNAVYTVNGVAVRIDDLTEQDAVNWNAYDPADVVPGSGYPSLGKGPVLKGAAKNAVLAGATIVLDFTLNADGLGNDTLTFEIFDESFVTFYLWQFQTIGASKPLYADTDNNFDLANVALADGAHKIAFTQNFSGMAWSLDGAAADSVVSANAVPAPSIVGLYLDGGNPVSFCRSIRIMPIQSNSALPALSAP